MIKSINKKIQTVMTGNNIQGYFLSRSFLSMASKTYGGIVKLRRTFYNKSFLKSKKLPCIVISIGNITVGGTGKTPMTIYLADFLKRYGYKVVVISRGYKGKYERFGGIVSDGKGLLKGFETAGDEPYMMAIRLKNIPVIVGKNRYRAGMLAVRKFNPDVIVLDDAFQHLSLGRDIDLLLLDTGRPFGNGRLLPRGVLREPVSALSSADALILTRYDTADDTMISSSLQLLAPYSKENPIFRSSHRPFIYKIIKGESEKSKSGSQRISLNDLGHITGRSLFVFSGLADNRDFRRTLIDLKCDLAGFLEFPDHHPYSDEDLEYILTSAEKNHAECLITTEKDYARLAHKIVWPMDFYVVGIETEFGDDTDRFNNFIKDRLNKRRAKD